MLDLVTLICNICTSINDTTQALSQSEVPQCVLVPSMGRLSHEQQDEGAQLVMPAIYQGVCKWNPAGPLMVGLRPALDTSRVTAELAVLPDNPCRAAQVSSL